MSTDKTPKKARKPRTVIKKIPIDKSGLVECSLVIDHTLVKFLNDKLDEFDRSKKSEMSTFAGLTVYMALKDGNRLNLEKPNQTGLKNPLTIKKDDPQLCEPSEFDKEILGYINNETANFQKKYNLSDRKSISDDDRKHAHIDTIRFLIESDLNECLMEYAETLESLSLKFKGLTITVSKVELIFSLLYYAKNHDIPKRRDTGYLSVVKETGLKESLVKDVLEKAESSNVKTER